MKKTELFGIFGLCLTVLFGAGPVRAEEPEKKKNYFPADLFSSAEACGAYFANADYEGVTYEQIDGEWVMNVPLHSGREYLYSLEPVPYKTYTLVCDFSMNLRNWELKGIDSGDEADILIGAEEGGMPFHQIMFMNNFRMIRFMHHYHSGKTFEKYEEDEWLLLAYDLEEDQTDWFTARVEVTETEATVYLDDDLVMELQDTANLNGEKGYIGIRGGSAGGWRIKNLRLYEGICDSDGNPGEQPTIEPAATASETPSSETPSSGTPASGTAAPETAPSDSEKNGSAVPWIIAGSVLAAAAIGTALVLLIRKKKKA